MNAQTDAAAGQSPYERVLGGAMHELHPRLRAYFTAIPPGHVGYGRGTFDVVGTPRRVLWPVLAILGRLGVAFPVHEFYVPFSVENRQAGPASVGAMRRFGLHGGTRMMWDVMHETRGRLVDVLGRGGRIRAAFDATVIDGALELRSTSVGVLFGPLRLRMPSALAPRVRLVEQFDDETQSQHVDVTLDAPLLGRLYEYSGSFTYEVRPEEAA